VAPGFTHVRNCAYIDWNGLPGDPNPHNEYACAELSNLPPWHPDARAKVHIQKDAQPTCSRTGVGNPWTCLYAVRIKNSGTAPLNGPIEFTDELNAHPATLLGIFPAPWNCVPGIGLAGPYTCTHPAVPGGLLPGDEVSILMGFELPPAIPVPGWQQNTATIKWDNDGDGVDEDHQASAIALICDAGSGNCAQDLAVLKLPPAGPCLKGDTCQFSVQVQNLANVNYPGPVIVTDIPDPGVGPPNVLTPGWACVPAGGSYTCTNPAPILPAAVASFDLESPVLPGYASPTLENCAEVAPGPNNVFGFNDKDCATAVVPFPDLAPWSPSSCELGTDCSLDVQVDNKGLLPFVGAAGLRGTLSPAVKIKSITGQTPGLSCKVTGFGAYECVGQVLNIAPGDAAKLQFIAVIPANFPHKEITHTKTMLWPDRKVKDTNPKNDIHTSIITIEQPEKPVPPPPPAGRPDLAMTKTANQAACRAGSSCGYTLNVRSVGTAPYSGAIAITDIITPANATLAGSRPAPWSCRKTHGSVLCTHPSTTLAPGQSKSLSLNFTLPRNARGVANNCATINPGAASRAGGNLRDVQSALAARGFNPGPADGKMGRNTRNAIRAYEGQNNMRPTGRVTSALLNSLFGGAGGKDSNPANNRACAASSIIAAPTPPPPPQCTGGRFRNNKGACVCPSTAPLWTGQICVPRPPQQCTGGRFRDNKGVCVCPTNKPVWTGQVCIPRPPQACSGDRVRNNYGNCVCPANAPVWTGVICIPKINICSGGRVFNLQRKTCVCPSNKPIWTGKSCVSRPSCSGGKILDSRNRCVCPSNKPFWNGRLCTPYSTFPIPPTHGGGQTTTPPPSEISCSGGRIRNSRGQCVCPSNKPQWTGSTCIPRVQIKPQGPVLKLPGGTIKRIPGIRIQ
ncbi:MAG: peptidoglycan-binding protein, partial [Alphaproteobacteria bacterium]